MVLVLVFVAGRTKNSTDCTVARSREARGTGDYAHALAVLQQQGWRSVKQTATGGTRTASLFKGGWTIQLDYNPATGALPTPKLEVIAYDDLC